MTDLDKIRAVVKRWAPGVAAVAVGTVGGASLTLFVIRAAAGFAADKGGTVMAVAAVLAIASANALWWWYRDRDQAAKVREARRNASHWLRLAAERAVRTAALQEENERLAAENERLKPGEVVSLLHKRMGDQP